MQLKESKTITLHDVSFKNLSDKLLAISMFQRLESPNRLPTQAECCRSLRVRASGPIWNTSLASERRCAAQAKRSNAGIFKQKGE
jgi:hypothetical protein